VEPTDSQPDISNNVGPVNRFLTHFSDHSPEWSSLLQLASRLTTTARL
jgi:hypothetical protein